MQVILELIQKIIEQHQGDVMMAWVQFIPGIVGGLGSAVSGIFGGRKAKKQENQQMQNIENKIGEFQEASASKLRDWNNENREWYDTQMNRDYSQTPEALNMMRQLREEMDRQGERSANNNVVSGATVETQALEKDSRNKAMSNVSGNIASMATAYKNQAENRYMNNQSQMRGMEMNNDAGLRNMTMGVEQQKLGRIQERRDSAGNLLYNGLTGLAGQDWAGILGN